MQDDRQGSAARTEDDARAEPSVTAVDHAGLGQPSGVVDSYGRCRHGAGLTMATETIRFRRRRRWRDPAM